MQVLLLVYLLLSSDNDEIFASSQPEARRTHPSIDWDVSLSSGPSSSSSIGSVSFSQPVSSDSLFLSQIGTQSSQVSRDGHAVVSGESGWARSRLR